MLFTLNDGLIPYVYIKAVFYNFTLITFDMLSTYNIHVVYPVKP